MDFFWDIGHMEEEGLGHRIKLRYDKDCFYMFLQMLYLDQWGENWNHKSHDLVKKQNIPSYAQDDYDITMSPVVVWFFLSASFASFVWLAAA